MKKERRYFTFVLTNVQLEIVTKFRIRVFLMVSGGIEVK